MLNKRLNAARAVAAQLMPTEEHIENAILAGSRLAIAIIEGRKSAGLPITTGQDSLAAVTSVNAALIEARLQIGRAHASLAQDKVDIGLGSRAMGDWGDCPPPGAEHTGTATLRVVS